MEKVFKKGKLKSRDIGSVFLVYDYTSGVVVELNESARFVWECLDDLGIEDVIQKFADYYGIDSKTAAEDVYMVLNELEVRGLIGRERC
jgi:hypothetical protein